MQSYIEWIRGHVGKQNILLVFASACVRDEDGRVLWQRRADFGRWGLPGGALEIQESLPQCVVREVWEETGLAVEPTRLVGIYSSPDFAVTYPNGDQVQAVTFCFECRVTGGKLSSRSNETLDLAWFPVEKAPATFSWYAVMIEDLVQIRTAVSFRRGRPGGRRTQEPFYKFLRRYIGRAPFISPAAAAFIQDERGHVLLQRRGDNGRWGLCGGGMELGERIDQTIVNEVREESGLIVAPVRVIGVYSDPQKFWITYPNGDEIKIVSTFFECRILGGRLEPDGEESLELRFFPPDALPPMAERHVRRIRDGLGRREQAIF